VTLDSVYYQGQNVPGHFLLANGSTMSYRAYHSNFTWGQHSNSQVWFSLSVTVSSPSENDDTLFKLYNGQDGIYSFLAVVDVEWVLVGSPSTGPVSPPFNSTSSFPFKKRMTLQGAATTQGSQFTTQVQIAGPAPLSQQSQTPVVSSASSIALTSILYLVVNLVLFF